jgi:Holliday junction resolvase-like predicted endonuclease
VCLDAAATLVAVEVKLRRSARTGSALEALGARQLSRLRHALLDYARQSPSAGRSLRIDLVAATPVVDGWRLVRLAAVDAW